MSPAALAAPRATGTAPPAGQGAARSRAWRLSALLEYGRVYAQLQQRFNGERPVEELQSLITLSSARSGLAPNARLSDSVPYWDLDPARAQGMVQLVGDPRRNPFVTPEGKVRVRVHYMNQEDRARLEKILGAPAGFEPATMLSSYRTLLVETSRGPEILKFSGKGVLTTTNDAYGAKILTAEQVQRAVAAAKQTRRYGAFVNEPAGLVLTLGDGQDPIVMLARRVPVAKRGYRKGDVVLPEHVLSDPEFATTELGQAIFARHGSQARWFRKELAPAVADLLLRSLTRSFLHAEVHPQNLDVIVDRHGRVVEVQLKDLQDLQNDLVARAAARRKPLAWTGWTITSEVTDRGFADYYSDYFGQLGNVPDASTGKDKPNATNPFSAIVMRQLLQRARSLPALQRLADTLEYQAAFAPRSWRQPMAIFALLRRMLIDSGALRRKTAHPPPAKDGAPGALAGAP
ncbi:MAG: hypothetical protein IT371_05080 [Deltaproteobacteria bacterium]|nr:hypothetical protein [Deltaproteobacteria bacterium]